MLSTTLLFPTFFPCFMIHDLAHAEKKLFHKCFMQLHVQQIKISTDSPSPPPILNFYCAETFHCYYIYQNHLMNNGYEQSVYCRRK